MILIVFAKSTGDAWRVTSLSIFGATMILLYLISTFYHSITHERTKRLFRILDHSSIYLLIAGTYTPVVLVALRGPLGWTLFGLIWGMAVTGVILKSLILEKFKILSVFYYILMGWLVVIALKPLIQTAPRGLILWLLAGGISYTLGTVFYAWKKLPYHHVVWHFFVLGGSASHFFGLFFYIASA